MLGRICSRQPGLLEHAATGSENDPTVQAHLDACPSCREAVEMVCWMREMSGPPAETHPLPDASLIWWKAQLLRRWEAERRAVAPIENMHRVELVAGLMSLAVFVVWQWSGLGRLVSMLNPALFTTWTSPATASPQLPVLVFGTLLIGVMVLAGVHRLLKDN